MKFIKNKAGFSFTIFLVLFVLAILVLIAFFVFPGVRWVLTGVGLIVAGVVILGKGITGDMTKGKIVVILILIGAGIVLILTAGLINTALQQTILGTELTIWQKSIIPCVTVNDCSAYLLQHGVSQVDLNTAELKCENKLCYFKSK